MITVEKRLFIPHGLLPACLIIMGLMVITGWHTENAPLLHMLGDFPTMPYNAGLGFLIAGLAIFIMETATVLSRACSLAVVFMGALTTLQYLFVIDQGFIAQQQMELIIGICFSLIGLSIFLLSFDSKWLSTSSLCVSYLVFLLSISIILISHLASAPVAVWVSFTKMPIDALIGFFAASCAVINLSWAKRKINTYRNNLIFPIFMQVSAVILFSFIYLTIESQDNELLKKDLIIGLLVTTIFSLGIRYSQKTQPKTAKNEHRNNETSSTEFYLSLNRDLSDMVNASDSYNESLRLCLDHICKTLSWNIGHIYRLNTNEDAMISMRITYADNHDHAFEFVSITKSSIFKKGIGLPGRVWSTKSTHWINDVKQDSNFPRAKAIHSIPVSTAVGFPITINSKCIAVVEMFTYEVQDESRDNIRLFNALSQSLSFILESRILKDFLLTTQKVNTMLLDYVAEGIYGIDKHGNCIFINKVATSLLGYSYTEVKGKSAHALFHHTDSSGCPSRASESPLLHALQSGLICSLKDETFWRKDGSSFR